MRKGAGVFRRQSINIHDLLVVLAEVEVLFVVEEEILRWGRRTEMIRVDMRSAVADGGGVRLGVGRQSNASPQ